MNAYRVPRAGGYGYEIADETGNVVETGVLDLRGTVFAARPDGSGGLGPVRPGSEHLSSPEVLAWLSVNGPAGGAR